MSEKNFITDFQKIARQADKAVPIPIESQKKLLPSSADGEHSLGKETVDMVASTAFIPQENTSVKVESSLIEPALVNLELLSSKENQNRLAQKIAFFGGEESYGKRLKKYVDLMSQPWDVFMTEFGDLALEESLFVMRRMYPSQKIVRLSDKRKEKLKKDFETLFVEDYGQFVSSLNPALSDTVEAIGEKIVLCLVGQNFHYISYKQFSLPKKPEEISQREEQLNQLTARLAELTGKTQEQFDFSLLKFDDFELMKLAATVAEPTAEVTPETPDAMVQPPAQAITQDNPPAAEGLKTEQEKQLEEQLENDRVSSTTSEENLSKSSETTINLDEAVQPTAISSPDDRSKSTVQQENQVLSVDTQLANEVNASSDLPSAVSNKIEEDKQKRTENEQKERIVQELEKQKVISVLRDFDTEQNKETKTHIQMAENIKKMEELCTRSLTYYPDMRPSCKDFAVDVNWEFASNNYKEIVVRFKDRDEKLSALSKPILTLKLLFDIEKYKDNTTLTQLIDEYSLVSNEIMRLREKLWQDREKVVYRFLELGFFDEWRDENLLRYNIGQYDRDGQIFLRRNSDKKEFVFSHGRSIMQEVINSLKVNYNITADDLSKEPKDIQEISWSDEEKENLNILAEVTEDFSAGKSKEIKNELVVSFPGFKFTENNLDQMVHIYREGAIRNAYEQLSLPPEHESTVVKKIMLSEAIL